jgi:hypothetical protein
MSQPTSSYEFLNDTIQNTDVQFLFDMSPSSSQIDFWVDFENTEIDAFIAKTSVQHDEESVDGCVLMFGDCLPHMSSEADVNDANDNVKTDTEDSERGKRLYLQLQ